MPSSQDACSDAVRACGTVAQTCFTDIQDLELSSMHKGVSMQWFPKQLSNLPFGLPELGGRLINDLTLLYCIACTPDQFACILTLCALLAHLIIIKNLYHPAWLYHSLQTEVCQESP